MKVFALLAALVFTGCATAPQSSAPWQSYRTAPQVTYRQGGQVLTLRDTSPFSRYRLLQRSEFLRHHVPIEASSAFVGRDGAYDYDVFYTMEEDRGTAIYHFNFGKFDIDLPAKLLYRIDRKGKATRLKSL